MKDLKEVEWINFWDYGTKCEWERIRDIEEKWVTCTLHLIRDPRWWMKKEKKKVFVRKSQAKGDTDFQIKRNYSKLRIKL
jgi:hypothetical protein